MFNREKFEELLGPKYQKSNDMIANVTTRTNRAMANQFVITKDHTVTFKSYDTYICTLNNDNGTITFYTNNEFFPRYTMTTRRAFNNCFRTNWALRDFTMLTKFDHCGINGVIYKIILKDDYTERD